MLQESRPNKLSIGLGIGIALIQIFDILIHASTNQLEPFRVTSNILILLWTVGLSFGLLKNRSLPVAAVFIGLYVLLNAIFLAREGLTNPAQGDSLRIMLLLLVTLTITLSTYMLYLRRRWR